MLKKHRLLPLLAVFCLSLASLVFPAVYARADVIPPGSFRFIDTVIPWAEILIVGSLLIVITVVLICIFKNRKK